MASDLPSAALALLWHYFEYLTSPGVILTTLIVVVPVIFGISAERVILYAPQPPLRIPGCRRLGLRSPSNLDAPKDLLEGTPHVKALFTYPIKSCRGVEVPATEVEASGLRYDRLFTFAESVPKPGRPGSQSTNAAEKGTEPPERHWRFITQREYPKLALLSTELWLPDPRGRRQKENGQHGSARQAPTSEPRPRSRTRGSTLVGKLEKGDNATQPDDDEDWASHGGCLMVRFMYEPTFNPFSIFSRRVTIALPLAPSAARAKRHGYRREILSIWTDQTQAFNITGDVEPYALERLSSFLGAKYPLALFRVDEAHKRAVTRSLPKDKPDEQYNVGFADAFPTNLLSISSVQEVDGKAHDVTKTKQQLDPRRFRANIYVGGTAAFAEDSWKSITAGRRIGRDKNGLFEVDAEYHVACRTARCKVPNVDPDTGISDRNEPYSTMSKTRRIDEGADPHPCLGMQMIPLFERGIIRVGDKIEVLETGEHRYEKMFP